MENKNYYFDVKHLEVNQEGRGTQVHPLIAIFLAISIGGLFVVFLPFIGLYLFIKHMASLAVKPIKALFTTSFTPIAEPGNAYMTGASPGKSEAGEETLKDLAKEINDKRNN